MTELAVFVMFELLLEDTAFKSERLRLVLEDVLGENTSLATFQRASGLLAIYPPPRGLYRLGTWWVRVSRYAYGFTPWRWRNLW
jgi:hypothetical protein